VARLYYDYTFFNITNAKDVALSNAVPEVKEVGPFSYVEFCRRRDVVFNSDNSQVEFSEMCWKEFQPDRSIDALTGEQLSDSQPIMTFNFVLYGALAKTGLQGKESSFKLAVMSTVFKSLALAALFGSTAATQNYAMYWGNSAAVKAGFTWTASGNFREVLSSVAGNDIGFMFEYDLFWATTTDATAVAYRTALTGSSDPVTTSFDNATANAIMFGDYGLTKTFAAPTPFESLGTIPGTLFIAACVSNTAYPEYCKSYYGSSMTAADITRLGVYLKYASIMYLSAAFTAQGATNFGQEAANHYFLTRSVRELLFATPVDPLASRLGSPSPGSYFSYTDCPAEYKAAHAAGRALDPDTCETEWRTTTNFALRFRENTGRSDPENTEQLLKWNSLTALPKRNATAGTGYWCSGDVPIMGRRNPNGPPATVDWGRWRVESQVARDDFVMELWNSEVLRNVKFKKTGESHVKGVPVLVFGVEESMLEVDPVLDVEDYGVFNLACPKGVPFSLTHQRFMRTAFLNDSSVQLPDGMLPYSSKNEILLYTERYTGKTVDAKLKLQLNFDIPAGIPGISHLYTASAADATDKRRIFPLAYLTKGATLTDSNASDLKAVNNVLGNVVLIVFVIGCVVGPLLIIAAVVLLLLGRKKSQEDGNREPDTPSGANSQSSPDEFNGSVNGSVNGSIASSGGKQEIQLNAVSSSAYAPRGTDGDVDAEGQVLFRAD